MWTLAGPSHFGGKVDSQPSVTSNFTETPAQWFPHKPYTNLQDTEDLCKAVNAFAPCQKNQAPPN